jgi:hypothetical protein
MEAESEVWARRADPSIKLSRYLSNRKIYDRGSACAQTVCRREHGPRSQKHKNLIHHLTVVAQVYIDPCPLTRL